MNEFIFSAEQEVNFQITPEGYLDIDALVIEPGEYNVNGQKIIITKEVLEKSKGTLLGKALTKEHPDEFVNSDNNKFLSVGFAFEPRMDDDGSLKSRTRITDSQIIKQINDTQIKGISAGFTADLDTDGIATDINFNHLAILVDSPRCESAQLLFSKKNILEGGNMKTTKMQFDDNKLADAVESVEDALASVENAAPNDNEILKAKISELEGQIEALKTQIKELIGETDEGIKEAYESGVEMGFSINFAKGSPTEQIEEARVSHLKEEAKKHGLRVDDGKNYDLNFLKGFLFSKKEDKVPNASTRPAPSSVALNFSSEKSYKKFKLGSTLTGGN